MFVDDASMNLLDQFLWVSDTFREPAHDGSVTLALYVGDIVAQADVAPLEYSIHFGFLTYDFLIEVKDSTVILAKLLNNLWRYKTTIY